MSRKTLSSFSFLSLSLSLSLSPFASFPPFPIVFLYILPFRQKCCQSFPQKGVLRKRQGELGKGKAAARPLCPPQICHCPEVSPLPLETYLLPYIQDSQPHPPASEHHVYEFLLTLDFKKLLGGKNAGLVMRNHFVEYQTRISWRISGDPP